MLTASEKRIIREIQNDLPLCERPFLEIAERVGVTEEEVLQTVDSLLERGLMRRFGAAVRHQRVGYKANALVVWRAPEGRVEEVGLRVASFREVTHCYQREPLPGWPYNLYAMVHKHTQAECLEVIRQISKAIEIDDYLMLFSSRELKRASMLYFIED